MLLFTLLYQDVITIVQHLVAYKYLQIPNENTKLNRNSLGFPDFASQKLLQAVEASSHVGTTTITSKGYVYVGIRASVDRRVQLSVNGKTIVGIYVPAASNGISQLIPVKQGDIVTYNLDVGNTGGTVYQTFRYFVPMIE